MAHQNHRKYEEPEDYLVEILVTDHQLISKSEPDCRFAAPDYLICILDIQMISLEPLSPVLTMKFHGDS
jgi:hypothetical protein